MGMHDDSNMQKKKIQTILITHTIDPGGKVMLAVVVMCHLPLS